ncbi:hypothetical protein ISF_06568 [Cordyceps fumosorosea ARSEF 2679]|uniref:Uncharacterized protein n=1 Tax=Cordyceps fumosorosea (strain ARSEF 2679) TaxID=1081104 RepID=A0A167RP31_CORFA|nr:hypothetical protein ISF_06568 [Cordyceps fumosorosea ARSEF 2679]OAA58785.1 hypothetical protein ISF_06568 [Cordyceps fumosorosea ARSEF 2679]
MDMAVVKRKDLKTSELAEGGSPSGSEAGDPKSQNAEDAQSSTPEDSRTATYTEAGFYTDREIEILTASFHVSPAGSISATPAAATVTATDHDRRFITLVRPPPNNPIADPSDSFPTRENLPTTQPQRLQSPSSTTPQRPSPTRTGAPNRNGAQVLFPTIVTPTPVRSVGRTTSSSTSSIATLLSSSTSSIETQIPPSTRLIETPLSSSTSSIVTPPASASASSLVSSALAGPSTQPEKQPDAAPTPVTSSTGLNRAAEAGIVIGSIALVSLVLGAALLYYYKRKPSANNIFTSRNKNLVPQRSISRPVPQDMPTTAAANQGRPTPVPFSRPSPPPQQQRAPAMAERPPVYARPERPLPPAPVRRSLMNRSSSLYSRLP